MKKSLKKYFVPSDDNDHQPHSLRDNSLRNILIVSILFEIIALVAILPVFNGKLDYLSAVLPSVLVSETNEERLSMNLSELKNNQNLVLAAQMKANDMAEKSYFSHVSPDGKQPWYFLTQAGYDYEVAGENLAVNFVDSKQVHEAWMESPTHKANILKDNYTEIGIATAKGQYKGRDVIFVAQFFGKPKVKPQIVEVVSVPQDINDISAEDSPEIETEEEVAGTSTTTVKVFSSKEDIPNESVVASISNNISNLESLSDNNDSGLSSRRILSSPVTIVSLIMSVLLILVSIALLMKIFIKIRVQYPKMILNSALVISVLASFYLLNSLLVDLFGEII